MNTTKELAGLDPPDNVNNKDIAWLFGCGADVKVNGAFAKPGGGIFLTNSANLVRDGTCF